MTANTTMTIRIDAATKDKLERIATATKRSKSFLAAEAITAYVERELKIVEGIQRGIEDMKAGRTVPHDQAMAEIRAAIDAAKRRSA